MNHFNVSVAKSVIRLIGFGFLINGQLFLSGSLLMLAEGLGIIEEMV